MPILKRMPAILLLVVAFFMLYPRTAYCQWQTDSVSFDFYGDAVTLPIIMPDSISLATPVTAESVQKYIAYFNTAAFVPMVNSLLAYKKKQQLDDWLYYQLIRKTAQQISPKQNNYERYTVCKWFLLTMSGYNATLKTVKGRLLFYAQTNESIFNIPYYYKNGKQYVCLNYHDYNYFEIQPEKYGEVAAGEEGSGKAFSYKVTQIPEGKDNAYVEKELEFNYYESINHFTVKLNPSIQQIFANYPAVDFESYFNIPLSRQTYLSLIPSLKKHLHKMSVKKGVDFLMRFTRYAFLFETDTNNFGREKRLTPEQTLLYKSSDCEDRVALFFYLVKEIYNLPMIVLSYPTHITIAVKLKKPVGKPIIYKGEKYTVAEPTPQKEDLELGKILPALKNTAYEIVYVYQPAQE